MNYHENGRKIFIEPLTRTTRASCIYGYRVPALDKLDLYTDQISEEDAVLDLSDSGDGPVSFLVFIGPADFVPLGKAIKLTYDAEGYSVAISVDGAPFQVPTGYETHFITFTPEEGHFLKQQMAEDQAMIAYHQAIIGSTEPILYQPNGDGVIRLIFSVQMRIAPKFKSELIDPELYVSDQDVQRDGRSEKVMLKFKVRNRNTGQIIRRQVAVKSIELDARL
ncbi:hypothetical protein [Methylobacter sp. sgz302048]|uniref:hypothetical protein n=1 Tax=Methylobacter sp. sgz302048 TaxID=3455945 RepID=UPI003FA04D8F